MPDITMRPGSVLGVQSIVEKLNRHGDLILKSTTDNDQDVRKSKPSSNLTKIQQECYQKDIENSIKYNDLEIKESERRETLDIKDMEKYSGAIIPENSVDSSSLKSTFGVLNMNLEKDHFDFANWKPTFDNVSNKHTNFF
jgi:hypothetical protein